jgi:hypothetical protein
MMTRTTLKGSSSSLEDSSQMSEDSSKEWMFYGTIEILHTMDWDRSDVAEDRPTPSRSHAREEPQLASERGNYRLWADYSEDIL